MKKHLVVVIMGTAAGIGIYKATRRKQSQAKEAGKHVPHGPYEACFKRSFDCVAALMALLFLWPFLGIVALLVRIKLGSPVIFTQERPGKDGKIFRLYKFRTMTDERDENGELLPDEMRLTEFGRKLRETSLDELPELINILKGDMSLVGPRPLLTRYIPAYTGTERHRHDVRSGLTGQAQINGRNYVSWDERLAYDMEYVNKITFMSDLKIIAKTFLKVLRHDGVAANTDEIDEGYLDEIRGAGR